MTTLRTLFLGTMAFCAVSLSCSAGSSEQTESSAGTSSDTERVSFSTQQLENHISYLASDELEGRAPGSKGEELTLGYLAEQYTSMGLQPGNPDGLFVQEVPLVGTTISNRPQLRLASDTGSFTLDYQDDFMGWTLRRENTGPLARTHATDGDATAVVHPGSTQRRDGKALRVYWPG